MKRINLLLVLVAFLLGACNSNQVKVRGEIEGLKGTVKLLAEMPGKGLVVLAQQQVDNGNIDLRTDSLIIPARVWVDIDGKAKVEAILDTKDMIWIKGKIKFPDQIEATGSGLMDEYETLKKEFRQKFGDEEEELNKKIEKLSLKERPTKDEEVRLGIFQMRKQSLLKRRFNYAKKMAIANPKKEVCLFLIQDELAEDPDAQKEVLKSMKIENKASNIYKVLENR